MIKNGARSCDEKFDKTLKNGASLSAVNVLKSDRIERAGEFWRKRIDGHHRKYERRSPSETIMEVNG